MSIRPRITWPDGKSFAFTVFDDTDRATLINNQAVYGLLEDLGVRTSKSVWMFDGNEPPEIPGITCENPAYLAWLKELQAKGFEIAWHLATWETSERKATQSGLDDFRKVFGHNPLTFANHASNAEGIYWGAEGRLTGWRRLIARGFRRALRGEEFSGHVESSPLFWGDLCHERIRYVRNFVFEDIDTLAACPEMPYSDPLKPWVKTWFAASAGADVKEFNGLIHPENIDRLEVSGGACIAYTHFGKGFASGEGVLDETFESRMSGLAKRNGWFVPVSTLLEFLETRRKISDVSGVIERGARNRLENRWLREQVFRRIKSAISLT